MTESHHDIPQHDIEYGTQVAQRTAHVLDAATNFGRAMLRNVRIEDARLETEVGDMVFASPVMLGAGWDTTGKRAGSARLLGFAGVEVGPVTFIPQDETYLRFVGGAQLIEEGRATPEFRGLGLHVVAKNLAKSHLTGVVGVNLGVESTLSRSAALLERAGTIGRLSTFADYFVINVRPPADPEGILDVALVADSIKTTKETLDRSGKRPLYVKSAVDELSLANLERLLFICVSHKVDGILAASNSLKGRMGTRGVPTPGEQGYDPRYQNVADERMRRITSMTEGTRLHRFSVGGIYDARSAIERLEAGAEIVQVDSAVCQGGLMATRINNGILDELNRRNIVGVEELIGSKV